MVKDRFTITIDDIEIEVTRKRVKHINLRIYPPDGQVRVSIPRWLSEAQARRFIRERMAWIKQKRSRIRQTRPQLPAKLAEGSTVLVWGEARRLSSRIISRGRGVELDGPANVILKIRADDDADVWQKVLDAWYRAQVKAQIPALAAKWEPIVGREVADWRVKKMRSKWGSCNIAARRINLNAALAKGPPMCLEMVVVHELVHLLERYHNRRFYCLMDNFLPGWREADALLKRIPLAPRKLD